MPQNGSSQQVNDLNKGNWLQGKLFLDKFLPVATINEYFNNFGARINESFNDFEEWKTCGPKELPWSKADDEENSSWFKWLFSWEASKSDSPWELLHLTRSRNYWVRQMGVASLAGKKNWDDHKYRYVAQAMEPRTAVALARYPHSSDAFFLPPPALWPDKDSIVSALRSQVSKLPEPPEGSAISYYRSLALQVEFPSQKDPVDLDLDVSPPVYTPEGEAEERAQRELSQCLNALVAYTGVREYAIQFVHNNGLAVLQRLYQEYDITGSGDPWVHVNLAAILANLSQYQELLKPIVCTGWLYILRVLSSAPDTLLSLTALTSLANLDKDWYTHDTYQDMILIHPTRRNSKPAKADIVFVHGLKGGSVKTWRQMDSDVGETSDCWPKDWLASDFPNARILSIGYNSDILRWGDYCPYESDKRTLEGRGRELFKKLQQAGVGSRPIIWVGHSMGGLLIKQMLSLCESDPDLRDLRPMTKGMVMYSVPHLGSPLADNLINSYAKYLLLPSAEVVELTSGSPTLKQLNKQFRQYMKESQVPILSFGETQMTNWAGSFKIMLVPQESSDPGIGRFVSLPVDHISTCKPKDIQDQSYQEVVNFIRTELDKKGPKGRLSTQVVSENNPASLLGFKSLVRNCQQMLVKKQSEEETPLSPTVVTDVKDKHPEVMVKQKEVKDKQPKVIDKQPESENL